MTKMQEYLCNFLYYLLTWALACLEVPHLATGPHYITQQLQSRGREKNYVAPKAGSGHHFKNVTITLQGVQTGQKLCPNL